MRLYTSLGIHRREPSFGLMAAVTGKSPKQPWGQAKR